ncbi:MAG TPA: DUF4384 domain-containing protein [Pyrinomonadaceae bacterium]|nr:DUF4384 domain-containing protein [Pyrinomonadaceae bacterium]
MRAKLTVFVFLIALGALFQTTVQAQEQEDVRGAFMTTRPQVTGGASGVKSTPSAKPNRRRPKPVASGGTGEVVKHDPNPAKDIPDKVNVPRMGLGLTLFMRDSNGLAVRTDPAHEFRKGDHVRFLIETNADGYLYVFNTTDGGQPIMIYPDPELDEAGNYFQAHVPFEIPSSVAAEERLRWLTFDEHAGAEKLYFVFTREPLTAVPIEDDLITYCRENNGKCPWRPVTDVWSHIQKEMNEPVKVARASRQGSAETSAEHRAVTRGIGLNRDDPEPALIMLTASTTKNILVAAVDLIHKAASLSASPSDDAQ